MEVLLRFNFDSELIKLGIYYWILKGYLLIWKVLIMVLFLRKFFKNVFGFGRGLCFFLLLVVIIFVISLLE